MTLKISQNHPLRALTTFKVGGGAAFFTEVSTLQEISEAVAFALSKKLPVFVLGSGSNVLISDHGFSGLVMKISLRGIKWQDRPDGVLVTASAGENWDDLVRQAVEKNLGGTECLSGVPGTVGAAPVQNIGCYGQSLDETLESVEAFDLLTREKRIFTKTECDFGYRSSIFKRAKQYIITSVSLLLRKNAKPRIVYHDLVERFGSQAEISLSEVREALLDIREKKGHLVMPGRFLLNSAGSYFKSPVVEKGDFERVKKLVEKSKNPCPPPWFWPIGERVKIAAACLIQNAGFPKGLVAGRIGISPRHPLAIINLGGASAQEIYDFGQKIKHSVKHEFGVELEEEVQLIGKF